ncbi:MAG: hypothetical protein HY864_10410 [Chloroflexi bacterium]|nr:hypothetical protein [Chloroflexota bacterium]
MIPSLRAALLLFAAKQSPSPEKGLLRREEHPSRNDGSADVLVLMAYFQ